MHRVTSVSLFNISATILCLDEKFHRQASLCLPLYLISVIFEWVKGQEKGGKDLFPLKGTRILFYLSVITDRIRISLSVFASLIKMTQYGKYVKLKIILLISFRISIKFPGGEGQGSNHHTNKPVSQMHKCIKLTIVNILWMVMVTRVTHNFQQCIIIGHYDNISAPSTCYQFN